LRRRNVLSVTQLCLSALRVRGLFADSFCPPSLFTARFPEMNHGTFKIDLENSPAEIRTGLAHLLEEYQALQRDFGTPVSFHPDDSLTEKRFFFAKKTENGWEILYGRPIEAFRALGRILAATEETEISESCAFEMLSLQLESSRNGVILPKNVKTFLRRAALMGINTLMLYLEDTYEVSGEPFFGYLRGRFTQAELKDFDDYAAAFGIEMVPCIQTLGHLKQALQWKIAFDDVTDTPDVMLVGEEKTYELLGRMIDAARAPFRSDKIHLGMDEAWDLGTGKYKKRFGDRSVFDIMNDHLARVVELCEERDLQPMIWSDMYFRIASETHEYYDLDIKIPQEVIERIPEKVDLVYWDYYHTDQSFYETYIERHREMKKEPIVAPGAWNWNHFWTNIPYSLARVIPCVKACKAKNLRRLFITTWGDDGMECDIFSVLPVVQTIADLAYGDQPDEEQTARNFAASSLADYHDYQLASQLDQHPPSKDPALEYSNTSKWLMWDDPLIGLCEPFQEVDSYRKNYEQLAEKLEAVARKENPGAKRLEFPAQVARVLALKCDLRKNFVAAWRSKDRTALKNLIENEAKPLLREQRKLWKLHREMWLKTYKPFGLEVIELRYGGQIARVESLIDRIEDFIDGKIAEIPEFDSELLLWADTQMKIGHYRRIATPSAIS